MQSSGGQFSGYLIFHIFVFNVLYFRIFQHSHNKRKNSLETRVELAVLCTYAENQVMLEPVLLYRTSKCKQTKEQGSEDCLWTHIFTFL